MAVGTHAAIADHIREKTWQCCVFTCQSFMASHFVVGAKLGNWLDTFLSKHAVQTAEGQALAVACAIAQTPEETTISKQAFGELCASCGLWILIRYRVLPELAIGSAMVDQLTAELKSTYMDGALHKSIRALRAVEPDAVLHNFGDLAAWVKANVSAVRTCQETMAKEAARQFVTHCFYKKHKKVPAGRWAAQKCMTSFDGTPKNLHAENRSVGRRHWQGSISPLQVHMEGV